MGKKTTRLCQLTTPFEKDTQYSWNEYPRPQFKRDSYISLRGQWQLSVVKDNMETPLGDIIVPYPPESRISGIQRNLQDGEKYIYRKEFEIEEAFIRDKVLLHFGAVDQIANVWINGIFAGRHTGGYLPFTLDITQLAIPGFNVIMVEVTDTLDIELAYGKQRRDRGGMWYTPISGIWQNVWLESVPKEYLQSMKLTPSSDSITIETTGGKTEKTVIIHRENGDETFLFTGDRTEITIENPQHWSPENPYLYNFTLISGEDRIESYFALRTVTIETVKGQKYICLNGKPYFFHGILDQGYFSDGIYTPATPRGYVWDILNMKKLGFNTLRKHIKVEPDLFYYYCDKYGMVVFQDMMNAGKYNYIIDTVLPTIGMKKGVTHKPSDVRKEYFEKESRILTDLLYNHPSVCYYTIFNEGWGQYEADRIYSEMKEYDPTRVWDATSGWFIEKESDVDSHHIYFRRIKLKARKERPLVLSEFGGYSYKVPQHSFNLDEEYGYKKFSSGDDLTEGIAAMYLNDIVPCIEKGLNAAILTQVSDVEDETNGIATYDRQIVKTDVEKMKQVADTMFRVFENRLK
ncbi:MAG: glycoside hydrolase family 2 [Oscillospiraceae bacterium]|nr:glycoside hydrolase family 2 [Oscillospiraceae bacterium]